MDIQTTLMQGASEIIHYDEAGIPLYISCNKLSDYPEKRALCHWHDEIELIKILTGEMCYYINGEKILLKKGDGVIVNARQMHYGCCMNQSDCTFICILFHPSLLSANKLLYQRYFLPILHNERLEYVYLDAMHQSHEMILDDIEEIWKCKNGCTPGYELEVIGMLHHLWLQFFRQLETHSMHHDSHDETEIKLLKNMVSYIHQHYPEKIMLADIAASGGVCRSKCCSIFRQYLMMTPINFVNTYRLEVSCDLLKRTNKSITDIAFICGFNHLSYYIELFQRTYHCTPNGYRQAHGRRA